MLDRRTRINVRTANALMIGKCEGSEIRGMTPNFNVRPGPFVSGATSDATLAGLHGSRRSRNARGDWTSVSRPPFVAANGAPLIDARAATRGRVAMEGGDAGWFEEALSVRTPAEEQGGRPNVCCCSPGENGLPDRQTQADFRVLITASLLQPVRQSRETRLAMRVYGASLPNRPPDCLSRKAIWERNLFLL